MRVCASLVYSHNVSGFHRYVSTVITPHRHDGLHKAVQELDSFTERYPSRG